MRRRRAAAVLVVLSVSYATAQAAPAQRPAEPVTVFAHYTTWYSRGEVSDGRSWPPDELAGRLLNPMPRYPRLNDEGSGEFGLNHGYGGYDAVASRNMRQHIAWAKEYGIDVFAFLWDGPSSRFTTGIEKFRALKGQMPWVIFYDTNIRFGLLGICTISNPLSADQPCTYDLNQKVRDSGAVKTLGQVLVDDLKRLKQTGWIDDPDYFRVNGRPVVWIYQAFLFSDQSSVEPSVRRWTSYIDEIRQWYWDNHHTELYLVGNLAGGTRRYNREWDPYITRFDAVSGWTPYTIACRRDSACDCCRPTALADQVAPAVATWADAVPSMKVQRVTGDLGSVEFAPFITPQFDDQWTKGPGRPRMIAASKDDFKYMAEKLGRDMLRGNRWLFLATFNAWPEGTTVEPTCNWKEIDCSPDYSDDRGYYGMDFLEVIREAFGG
ncbi:MAG: glycoside hydrolase family 99-like domain-containing protein [Acidobacteriota bacterium]